ncbi:MAG: gamma-glutamylcyclotransferase [Gloeotrichia echinulata GP01]
MSISFADSENLTELDQLEDYQATRQKSENLYNREHIEIFNLDWLSLGRAWVYLMTLDRVHQLRGFPQPDGWWSGCGLTPNTAQLGN